MQVQTRNSVYSFTDLGDGAFEVTSTNERFPGPYKVHLYEKPDTGKSMIMFFLEDYGFRSHLLTSQVVAVTENA